MAPLLSAVRPVARVLTPVLQVEAAPAQRIPGPVIVALICPSVKARTVFRAVVVSPAAFLGLKLMYAAAP